MTIFWLMVKYAFIILLIASAVEWATEITIVAALGAVTWIGAMVFAVEIMYTAGGHDDPPDPGPPGGTA